METCLECGNIMEVDDTSPYLNLCTPCLVAYSYDPEPTHDPRDYEPVLEDN
jgi:hypothetical protein